MMRKKKVTIVGNCQAAAMTTLYRDFIGVPNLEDVTYFNDHDLPAPTSSSSRNATSTMG